MHFWQNRVVCQILAFSSHSLTNFQPILDYFIPNFKFKYENWDNIKRYRVHTVIFSLHQIKQSNFFLGYLVKCSVCNLTSPAEMGLKTGGIQLNFIRPLPTLATHQLEHHSFVKLLSSLNVFIVVISTNCWIRYIGLSSIICSAIQESIVSTSLVVFSWETVWTKIPVLCEIYRLAINRLNFLTTGLYEVVINNAAQKRFRYFALSEACRFPMLHVL